MSGLVFAAIVPHGTMAIPGARQDEDRLALKTRSSMQELERRFQESQANTVIVLTPHNVHVEGSMAVVEAGTLAGDLALWEAPQISLQAIVDRELAAMVKASIRSAGIPVRGVSFGANDPEQAVMPMDWAVLVPLWFLGGRAEPPVPVVVVSPARDLPVEAHVEAGRAIREAANRSDRRVALVASADHGHGHSASGRYGFRPESRVFDERVVELIRSQRLEELAHIDVELVKAAAADSWWQMLMLHGALESGWRGEFLSYEAPTYFGMVCAAYVPED